MLKVLILEMKMWICKRKGHKLEYQFNGTLKEGAVELWKCSRCGHLERHR